MGPVAIAWQLPESKSSALCIQQVIELLIREQLRLSFLHTYCFGTLQQVQTLLVDPQVPILCIMLPCIRPFRPLMIDLQVVAFMLWAMLRLACKKHVCCTA